MGKTSSLKAQQRREAAAALRRAEEAAQRRRRIVIAASSVAAVVVVLGLLVGLKLAGVGGSATASKSAATDAAAAPVVKAVSSVPAATLDAVGAGTANNPPHAVKAAALTADGKPRVLYLGAEYCPYCAAQRWGLAVALARFGSWSELGLSHSAADDAFPNTATLSFHGADLTSSYVSFTGVETTTNVRQGSGYEPLDTPSDADQKLASTYDQPKYTGADAGSIPFLDIAGQYVQAGASYSPQLLAGMTQQQIAAELAKPDSAVAKAVDGTANVITAAICKATNGKPAAVCSSAGVQAGAKQLVGAGQ